MLPLQNRTGRVKATRRTWATLEERIDQEMDRHVQERLATLEKDTIIS